jgi:hypothetical protein
MMLTEKLESLILDLDKEIARLTRLRAEARSALGRDDLKITPKVTRTRRPRVAAPVLKRRRRRRRTDAEKELASQRMKDSWARRKEAKRAGSGSRETGSVLRDDAEPVAAGAVR